MTTRISSTFSTRFSYPFKNLGVSLRGTLREMALAKSVMRERKALEKMSDSELKDIGITREQADFEARRALWDIPSNRVDHN